jgi:hypothetical protein
MRDVEKVTHVFRFTPITFSGCLLETVLLEDESSRSSSKPSPKTMVEWTTRLSSELKEDDMRKLRDFKLNLVHIHGQNPGGEDYLDINGDPTQIELTFSSYSQHISIDPCIPSHLDQPSDPRYKDIDLKFSI